MVDSQTRIRKDKLNGMVGMVNERTEPAKAAWRNAIGMFGVLWLRVGGLRLAGTGARHSFTRRSPVRGVLIVHRLRREYCTRCERHCGLAASAWRGSRRSWLASSHHAYRPGAWRRVRGSL